MARREKTQFLKIRSLNFLRSIRTTEREAWTLMETLRLVFTQGEDYRERSSAWGRFLDLQELIAGRIRYQDWTKVDGETLLSLAQGRFAIQDALKNFFPGSVRVSDEDKRGLFFWNLLLKSFADRDPELLRECALCWLAFPFVVAEMTRHATYHDKKGGLHLRAGFARALHLYFGQSEDKNMPGADIIQSETARLIAEMAWEKLPRSHKDRVATRDGTAQEPSSAIILAQTYETLAKDRRIDPIQGLQQWLDGVFNAGPLAVQRDLQDESKKPQERFGQNFLELEPEPLKLRIAEASYNVHGETERGNISSDVFDEYAKAYPSDEALLKALYHINGATITELARKRKQTPKWTAKLAKKAEKRLCEWIRNRPT